MSVDISPEAVERLADNLDTKSDYEARDMLRALSARCQELGKDVARYQFLRTALFCDYEWWCDVLTNGDLEDESAFDAEVDSAIDAAMKP